MTAQVIRLPRSLEHVEPPSRRERLSDWLIHAQVWLESKTVGHSPVVLIRRSALAQREVNAFQLGRDCERYMRR